MISPGDLVIAVDRNMSLLVTISVKGEKWLLPRRDAWSGLLSDDLVGICVASLPQRYANTSMIPYYCIFPNSIGWAYGDNVTRDEELEK